MLAEKLNPDTTAGWRHLDCSLDGGPAPVAAIGMVTLATDMASEPEVRAFLPRDAGVELYVTRVPMSTTVTPQTLADLELGLVASCRLLLPGSKVDAVAFSCTSGGIAIGPARVESRIHEALPGVPVTMPITAATRALRHLGCHRLAIITPYPDPVNLVVEAHFAEQGFELPVKGSFHQPGDPQMNRVSPRDIYNAGLALGREDVDGVFISCTGLRVSPVLEALERELGKPVVASNQAQAWDCLRLLGSTLTVAGGGRLLAG